MNILDKYRLSSNYGATPSSNYLLGSANNANPMVPKSQPQNLGLLNLSSNSNPMMGLLGNPLFAIGTALLNNRQSFGQNLQQGFQNLMQQQMYKAEQDRKNRADMLQLLTLQNQLKTKPVGSPFKLNTADGPVLRQQMSDGTVRDLGTPFISKSAVQEKFDFIKNNVPRLKNLSDAEAFNVIRSDPTLMGLVSSKAGDTNIQVDLGKGEQDKTIKRSLKEKLFETGAAIQRITKIKEQYDPELLKLSTRLKSFGLETAEKLGKTLSSEQASLVRRMTNLKQDTLENLNLTIKQLTGAAMSEPEAVRIGGTVPMIGDSQTVFDTKTDNVIRNLKLAQARTQYVLTKGYKYKDDIDQVSKNLPLDSFENVIQQETKNIIADFAKQAERDGVEFDENNLTDDQKFKIKQKVTDLFGLI